MVISPNFSFLSCFFYGGKKVKEAEKPVQSINT